MSIHALKAPAQADWRGAIAEIAPRLAEEDRRCDEMNQFVATNFAALRKRGFLELGVPVELGGSGLTRTELAEMLRTLARHCSSTALALAMHTHVLAAAVWRWRPPERAGRRPPQKGRGRAGSAPHVRRLGLARWLRQGGANPDAECNAFRV